MKDIINLAVCMPTLLHVLKVGLMISSLTGAKGGVGE